MIAEHANAVKTLLGANQPLTGKVDDTVRVNATGGLVRANYAVLYFGGPDEIDDDRYTSPQLATSKAGWEFTVRYVGVDANSARLMFSAGNSALLRQTPTVAGRRCDPIRYISSDPVEEDRNVTPSLFYVDADYSLVSRPA